MKFLSLIIAFVLLSSVLQADTTKHSVEDFLHVNVEGAEAANTLRALDLPMIEGRAGKGKTFSTSKDSVSLYCYKRHYNVVENACDFTFDFRGIHNDVTLKAERSGMRFIFNNPKDSETLFNALLVPDYFAEGKRIRILDIDNGEVVVDCRNDSRQENSEPSCSVLVKL